jgi:hypothetical protein
MKVHIIGLACSEGNSEISQCFRVRAGVFARAHGRPNGMPGRIIGARAKRLRWSERSEGQDEPGRVGREDLKLEISDLGLPNCDGWAGTMKCERSNLRAD